MMLSDVSSDSDSDIDYIFGGLDALRSQSTETPSIQCADQTGDATTPVEEATDTVHTAPTAVDLTNTDDDNDEECGEMFDSWMTHDETQLHDLRWCNKTSWGEEVFWPVRILRSDELITNAAIRSHEKPHCELLGDQARRIMPFELLQQLPLFRGPNVPDTEEKYEQAKIKLEQRHKTDWVRWKNGLASLTKAYGLLEDQEMSLEHILNHSKRKARRVPYKENRKATAKRQKVQYVPYKREIKLHVGDTIQYNNRLFAMGTRQGREFSKIIEINPSAASPLVLESGYELKLNDIIMRVQRGDRIRTQTFYQFEQKPLRFFIFEKEERLEGAQTMHEELIAMARRDRKEINQQAMTMMKGL